MQESSYIRALPLAWCCAALLGILSAQSGWRATSMPRAVAHLPTVI